MKTKAGLVGLADTRITTGSEVFVSKKVSTLRAPWSNLQMTNPTKP